MNKEEKLMVEIIRRQLGHEPTSKEINQMKKLLSVQVNGANKAKKTLQALDDVYNNINCSWYDAAYERNKECLDKTGIHYRGNKLSKKYMFDRARDIAASLKVNGVKKGDIFPACVSNVPDLVTLLLATSYIGARIHIFNSDFAPEYIEKIINHCDTDFIFVSDDQYEKIKNILPQTKITKKILLSLADHLPFKFPKKYKDLNIPEELYKFENKIPNFKKDDKDIITMDEFIKEGEKFPKDKVKDKNPSIYDEFTITHSSGSTRPGMPKAIPHKVLSYITMMRFHDPDMLGLPDLSTISGLAHIPPISDTNLKSSISDIIGQRSIIACEPIYGANTFIYSLMMNEPNFCTATKSSWIQLSKDILYKNEFKNLKMPYLALPISVGESIEINERNLIDKVLKKCKAGSECLKKLKLPLFHTYIGEGGGRTESSGIFYTVFQSLFEKINKFRLKKEKYGMAPCTFADVAIINEQGLECNINEIGELCAKSSCEMSDGKYYFEEDNEESLKLTDAYDRIWPRFEVYAYRNELGNIIIKGRKGNEFKVDNNKIPEFIISDIVLSDRKNILSCEVINYNNIPIVNIEFNPTIYKNKNRNQLIANLLYKIDRDFKYLLPEQLSNNIVYRIIDDNNKFPLTGCAKRDCQALLNKGLERCIKPLKINDSIVLYNAEEFFKLNIYDEKYKLIKAPNILSKISSKIQKAYTRIRKNNKF